MNVTIERAGDMQIDVPITTLRGFRVDRNHDPDRPNRKRYRITALMSCADLPKDKPFGHSCTHGGPPPHLIRVFGKLPPTQRQSGRTEASLRRLVYELEKLSAAVQLGLVADEA